MDEWIKLGSGGLTGATPLDVTTLIISLAVCFILNFILARVYIFTHSGYSYSKSFVHSIVFVGITIDLIMLIIGSNIARAFALVGAMSIVRFRNPIKDSRDLIFLFMSMAIGMATGTQFYAFAVIFAAFAVLVLLAFHYLDFGETPNRTCVLKVRMPETLMAEVEKVCGDTCSKTSVIAVDRWGGDSTMQDVIFEVSFRKRDTLKTVMEGLTALSREISVTVMVGESNVSV